MVPTAATESDVTVFHTPDYVEFLKSIDDQEDEEKYDEIAQQFGLGKLNQSMPVVPKTA